MFAPNTPLPPAGTLHGVPAGVDDGCSCAPCSRCSARMAHYRAEGARDGIARYRAVRRVQALRAIGYTPPLLARLLGLTELDVHMFTADGDRRYASVYKETFARIAAGYSPLAAAPVDDLADTRPWPSPLAWDDIDDHDERPHKDGRWCSLEDCDCDAEHAERPHYHDTVDPIVVVRILNGENVHATRAEKEAVTAEWLARGRTWAELERITNWNVESYIPSRAKAGSAA